MFVFYTGSVIFFCSCIKDDLLSSLVMKVEQDDWLDHCNCMKQNKSGRRIVGAWIM
jgi:transposase